MVADVVGDVVGEVVGDVVWEVVGDVVGKVVGDVVDDVVGDVVGDVVDDVVGAKVTDGGITPDNISPVGSIKNGGSLNPPLRSAQFPGFKIGLFNLTIVFG